MNYGDWSEESLGHTLRAAFCGAQSEDDIRLILGPRLTEREQNDRLVRAVREMLLDQSKSFLDKDSMFGIGTAETEDEAIEFFRILWSLVAPKNTPFPLDESRRTKRPG